MKRRRSTSIASWWSDSVHVGPVLSGPATVHRHAAERARARPGTSTVQPSLPWKPRPRSKECHRLGCTAPAGTNRRAQVRTDDRAREGGSPRPVAAGFVACAFAGAAAPSCVACPDAPANLLRCTLHGARWTLAQRWSARFCARGVEFGTELDENGAAEQTLGRRCDARGCGRAQRVTRRRRGAGGVSDSRAEARRGEGVRASGSAGPRAGWRGEETRRG